MGTLKRAMIEADNEHFARLTRERRCWTCEEVMSQEEYDSGRDECFSCYVSWADKDD